MNAVITFTKNHWLFISVIILVLTAGLSLAPADTLPDAPGTDKTHHFIAYASIVFPIALAKPHRWLLMIFAVIMIGGCIELIQPFVNRYGEWLDFAANSLGVVIGIVIATLINFYYSENTA